MGKNDFMTPKAIANRIKAKGLNKLRWYCQLCQKSCRDENGFKCHQMSEGHRRQMEVFGVNPERVVDGFSEEFEEAFMDHLRRAHPSSRVAARDVYNEFIADRHHVHMNSTRWLTLTEFVKHLGREGKVKVDETDKGWYITIIKVDPAKALADAERIKRERQEEEEEERMQRHLQQQVERARRAVEQEGGGERAGEQAEMVSRELQRSETDGPITLNLARSAAATTAGAAAAAAGPATTAAGAAGAYSGAAASVRPPRPAVPVFGDDDDAPGASSSRDGAAAGAAAPRKASKLEELMQRDLADKQRRAAAAAAAPAQGAGASGGSAGTVGASGSGRRDASWLMPGIIVKVVSKALKEAGYYKSKARVVRVLERGFVAELEVLGSGDLLRVDQAELETVLPAPGGQVAVLAGPHAGARGTLLGIDERRFQAQVALSKGGGEVWLDYEDVSKLGVD